MKALDELRKVLPWCCEYADTDECRKHASCREHIGELLDAIEQELAERYVELPVDADDVPWHLGDVTENGNTVTAMGLNAHGWCFVGTTNDIDPSIHRHYHTPTVEDVLREFGKAWVEWEDGSPYDPIAAFAAKLQLKEVEQ